MKTQLKRVASVYTGTTPPTNVEAYYESEDVAWFTPGDIPSDNIYSEGVSKRIANLYFEEKSGKQFPKESVLMVGIGATVGKVCYSADACYSNQQINAIVFNRKKVLPKFGAYYLLNKSKEINTKTPIVTLQIFNQAKVKQIEIEYPDLDTQRRIVSYLDSHVSSIDKRVSLLTTKRDHYLRLKTAIINRAVTQGLNPEVKMKDSGVEWIGMIPEHWEVRLFKNVMKIRNGKDYKHIEADEEGEPSYPVIGSGGPFAFAKQAMYSGEVLFLGRKGTIDRPLYWNGAFWTVDTMFYAIPTKKTSCRYMYYLSLGFPFWKIGTQTALPSMTQTALNSIVLCQPPLSEQQAIATYLDEKCTKIDAIVENLNQQIEKHKLLKRALINEVITGQRAV